MWRRAHGRLAAIAVLAGGLLGCATAPKAVDDDEKQHVSMHCGYIPPLDPHAVAAAIQEKAGQNCGPSATAGARYGDFRAVVRSNPGREPPIEVEVEPSSTLNEDDWRCVQGAAAQLVDPRDRLWTDVKEDVVFYVALGTGPPLFPSAQELLVFVDWWLAATTSPPARQKFEARLPADVVLDSDGCLSIPNRRAFTDRLDRWLEKVDTPIDQFWEGANLLYAGLGPRASSPNAEGYLIGNQAVLLHYETTIDPSRQALCLLPLDDRLREELKTRVAQRATCLAGDLRDILLHPRTEFPTGRRFKTVAVGDRRACALDESGAPVCCGERLPEAAPAEAFSMVAVGTDFDCGLVSEGRIRCWGRGPPEDGVGILGPFSQVAVASREVCAIRRDTRVLQCWSAGEGGMGTVARDRTRDLAVLGDGLCELLEDGRIFCRGSQGWSGFEGRFRAFAASSTSVCGVTAAGNALRCWQDRPRWGWYAPKPDPIPAVGGATAEPNAVALVGPDGCVLGRSGRITCWRSRAKDRWDGQYRAIAASEGRVCAVTIDGRVQCDRDWPSGDKSTGQQR